MLRLQFKVFLVCFLIAGSGWGFPTKCLKHFLKLSAGELRYPDPDFLKQHNDKYSLELKPSAVSDQCGYGSCWIHARLANIEERVLNKTGKDVKLSRQFLIVQSLMDRIDSALESPISIVFQGGSAAYADKLIKRYGLVPDDPLVWKPKVNFEKAPHAGRLTYYLNARAAQFHVDAKDLVPESKTYLELQDKARKDMRDILKAYTGPLPKKIEVGGQSITPKAFAKSLEKDGASKPLWVFPEVEPLSGNLKKESSIGPAPLPSSAPSSRESLEKIEARIIRSLQRGQSVTLSYENNTLFVDRDTGIMSLQAFNTPEGFTPPSRLYRDAFLSGSGYHAVDIVGVDLDSSGKISKLKIKNSWGESAGDGGFYHMYRDYFLHFMNSIYVSDGEATRPSLRP